jgi:hypothetical protein
VRGNSGGFTYWNPPQSCRSLQRHDGRMADRIDWRRALLVGLTVGLGFALIGTAGAFLDTFGRRSTIDYLFFFLTSAAMVPPAVLGSAVAMKLRPSWGNLRLGCAAAIGIFIAVGVVALIVG